MSEMRVRSSREITTVLFIRAECPESSELYPSCPVHYRPIFTNLLVIDLLLRYGDGNIISAATTNVEFYWQINILNNMDDTSWMKKKVIRWMEDNRGLILTVFGLPLSFLFDLVMQVRARK